MIIGELNRQMRPEHSQLDLFTVHVYVPEPMPMPVYWKQQSIKVLSSTFKMSPEASWQVGLVGAKIWLTLLRWQWRFLFFFVFKG